MIHSEPFLGKISYICNSFTLSSDTKQNIKINNLQDRVYRLSLLISVNIHQKGPIRHGMLHIQCEFCFSQISLKISKGISFFFLSNLAKYIY